MRLLVLFFAFALTVSSQLSSWKVWHFQLPDGAYVSFASQSMVAKPAGVVSYPIPDLTGDAKLYGNTIEHVIGERSQTVLDSVRIEAAGGGAHVLTIQPVAGAPFFSRAPKPLHILDGQHAEIDLASSEDRPG